MEHHSDIAIGAEIIDDKYTKDILRRRYSNFKASYLVDKELKTMGLNIRHQNTPEDITENITKFIILNYEKDSTCVWCKGVDPKHKMTGDLYSSRYDKSTPIEVKSFTSDGPSQFGPDKKIGVLYFLDLRQWLDDKIVLWKVSLNHTSSEFLNIQVNKKQTMAEQLKEGRRPHIGWNKLYPQISSFCEKIFEGTFEDIFASQPVAHHANNSTILLAINETTGTETALPANEYNLDADRGGSL